MNWLLASVPTLEEPKNLWRTKEMKDSNKTIRQKLADGLQNLEFCLQEYIWDLSNSPNAVWGSSYKDTLRDLLLYRKDQVSATGWE